MTLTKRKLPVHLVVSHLLCSARVCSWRHSKPGPDNSAFDDPLRMKALAESLAIMTKRQKRKPNNELGLVLFLTFDERPLL